MSTKSILKRKPWIKSKMPFIPHTEKDIQAMLDRLGVSSIDSLFETATHDLSFNQIPTAINEYELTQHFLQHAKLNSELQCYAGGGVYQHYIPSAVNALASRGEFLSAYTPYQAEASQGSLQVIYEYQSMMAHLMGMEVSNASLYDGASALGEAILMAVRLKRSKAKRVIVPTSVNPFYRKVLDTVLEHQDIVIESCPYDVKQGRVDPEHLKNINGEGLAAIVIPQPNFFGVLEDVDALTDIAHEHGASAIACVNPTAMALLKEPGAWGENGADIACGEGQPLGVPLASGGPYFGFMCCNLNNVRQMPGRIVGKTKDAHGKDGFTLTLQAREQHIRRAKATSNICTNQGLMVTAATIYMTLLGAAGLHKVAAVSHANAKALESRLSEIEGVEIVFKNPCFHEFVIRLNANVEDTLNRLADQGLQAGFSLKTHYPELGECLLVCATETKTPADLDRYHELLNKELSA